MRWLAVAVLLWREPSLRSLEWIESVDLGFGEVFRWLIRERMERGSGFFFMEVGLVVVALQFFLVFFFIYKPQIFHICKCTLQILVFVMLCLGAH